MGTIASQITRLTIVYSTVYTIWRNYLSYPDSKIHGANMGPTWVLSAPGGPHVGPFNLAIRVALTKDSKLHSVRVLNERPY